MPTDTDPQPRGSLVFLLVSAVAFTGAVRGSTAANTLFVIPGVALLLIAVLRRSSAIVDNRIREGRLLLAIWAATAVAALTAILEVRLPDFDLGRETLWSWSSSAWIAVIAAGWLIGRRQPNRLHLVIFSVILISVVEIGFVLFLHPVPDIDVYHLHDAAAAQLSEGASPYRDLGIADSSAFAESGSEIDGYPYPPTTLVWFAIGSWLGDPRIASAFAWLLTLAIMAGPILKNDGYRFASAGLLLLLATQPGWILIVDQTWTEPLTLLLIVAAFGKWHRLPFMSGFLLGLAIVSKQYMIVLLPATLLMINRYRKKRLIGMVTGALAFSLPMAIADGKGLWDSTVVFLLSLPPRPDSSNLVGLAIRSGLSWSPPSWLLLLIPAALAIWVVRRIGGIEGLTLAYAAGLSVFFLLASQAFANYWFLIHGVTVLAIATSIHKPPRRADATAAPVDN